MANPAPEQKRSILPLVVIILGFLLLVAAYFVWSAGAPVAMQPTAQPVAAPQSGAIQPGLVAQSGNPKPTRLLPAQPTATPAITTDQTQAIQLPRYDEPSFPEVARVSLKDAKAAYDSKSAIIVDVRGTDAYETSHVTGALDIPLADIPSRANELDPHAWIITYCT